MEISRLLGVPGVSFWDVREEDSKSLKISIWNKSVKDIENSHKQGVSVRVLYKNGFGFCYGSNLKDVAIKALEHAKKVKTDPKKMYEGKAICANVKSYRKINPANVSISQKKDILIEESMSLLGKNIISSQLQYSEANINSHYYNSVGSDIRQDLLYTYAVCSLTAKGKDVVDYSDRLGEMQGFEAMQQFGPMCRQVKTKVLDLLNAGYAKGGNFPVVCDGALTDVFVHEAVGHAAEADIVMQDDSCLKGKLGKVVATNINVIDSALKNFWGSYLYDDEGNPAQENYLIKNGKFNSYMHSRETAAHFDSKPTGNSRAENFQCQPIVRMSNTYVERGDYDDSEIFEGIKKGFYLCGSKGGQVDTKTGDFQFNAHDGYLIENGKLTKRLREVSLSGNTLNILRSISRVSDKYEKGQPGMCGKDGQSVRVIGYNPRILIDKAMVGGA